MRYAEAAGLPQEDAAIALALGDGLVLHEQMGFIDDAATLATLAKARLGDGTS